MHGRYRAPARFRVAVSASFGAAPVVVNVTIVPHLTAVTLALFALTALAVAFATRQRPALAIGALVVSGPSGVQRRSF